MRAALAWLLLFALLPVWVVVGCIHLLTREGDLRRAATPVDYLLAAYLLVVFAAIVARCCSR